MKFRINDSVIVISGADRGKTGTVTKIITTDNRIVVDGINKHIKHVKGRDGQGGERVEFFAPIHVSNVAIADPKSGKATRVGYKIEGKTKTRIAKKSGEVILGVAKAKVKKTTAKKAASEKSAK
jgi:large subunit ribosomal protein L24